MGPREWAIVGWHTDDDKGIESPTIEVWTGAAYETVAVIEPDYDGLGDSRNDEVADVDAEEKARAGIVVLNRMIENMEADHGP